MNKEEIKFYLREEWAKSLRTFKYFMLEPFFIGRRWIYGKYTNMIVFWFIAVLFIVMWRKGVFGKTLKLMGTLVFLAYLYMFHRSGKADKYYEEEYVKGKDIE